MTMTIAGPTTHRRRSPAIPNDAVIPWLDQPDPVPPPAADVVGKQLVWEQLNSRLTPADNFFTVKHYGNPTGVETDYRLTVDGLVARPRELSLDDIKARPRREVEFTLECSGNTGLPFFIGGVGNAVWAGARLSSVLRDARVLDNGTEVIFWGADSGPVTIRDNSGVTGGGVTGTFPTDANGGLTITERFARSMSLEDAMASPNLLCYEMNGEPLPAEHGAPVRLIAPGWYGVANVKWLTHIEVTDRRYAGRFMARDYVTFRERTVGGQTLWTFTTVGQALLKSAPAKVTVHDSRFTIIGAAWGPRSRRSRCRSTVVRGRGRSCAGRTTRSRALRVEVLDVRLGHALIRGAHDRVAGDRLGRQRPAGTDRSVDRHQGHVLGEQRPDHPPDPHPLSLRPSRLCRRASGCAACCTRRERPHHARHSRSALIYVEEARP